MTTACKTFVCAATLALLALARPAAAQDASLMTPSKEHKAMAREVGVWEGQSKLWTDPSAEPIESKGVETDKMLGEMWLVGDYEGEMMGQPFHGRSQMTYDPTKKKYVGTWIDSISCTMMTLTGDYDAATHTLTMMMEGIDAMTGKPGKWKAITHYESDDAKTWELHFPVEGQEGKWFKGMEVKYKRKK